MTIAIGYPKNLSSIYWMVSKKFSSKNSKFYKECMAHYLFCQPAILQFSIFFKIACKELKIVLIAPGNQLFQLLNVLWCFQNYQFPCFLFQQILFKMNHQKVVLNHLFLLTQAELFSRRYHGVWRKSWTVWWPTQQRHSQICSSCSRCTCTPGKVE